jgi:TRAP-type C4-dicarboxylate transport system permease small subunit
MQFQKVTNDQDDPTLVPPKKPKLKPDDIILAILLGTIVAVMFFQVFFRYILNNSLSWSEEVVRFLFIWLTFLGAALNIRDKWHISVDFFVNILPKKWREAMVLFNSILLLLFLFFLTIGGFVWVYFAEGASSSALGLPLHLTLYGALPVTSMIGSYYAIRNIKRRLHILREEKKL